MNDFKDFANVGKSIASRAIDEIGGSGGFRTRTVQTENGHATIRTHGGYPRSYPGDGSGNRKEGKPGKLRAIMYGLQNANNQNRWDGWNSATGVPSNIPMVETPFSKSQSVTWYSPSISTGDGSPVVLSWKFQGLRCGRYATAGYDLLTYPSFVPIYSTGERSSLISLGGVSTITCSGLPGGVGVSSAALRLIDGAYWLYVISGVGLYRAKIKVFENDGLYPRPQIAAMAHLGDMDFSGLTTHPSGFSPLFFQLPFFNQSATKACLLVENENGYGSLFDNSGNTALYEIDIDSMAISLVIAGSWIETEPVETISVPFVDKSLSGNVSAYELSRSCSAPGFNTKTFVCCADYKDDTLVWMTIVVTDTSDQITASTESFKTTDHFTDSTSILSGGVVATINHSALGEVYRKELTPQGSLDLSQTNWSASLSLVNWPFAIDIEIRPMNCDLRADSWAFLVSSILSTITDDISDFVELLGYEFGLQTDPMLPASTSINTTVVGRLIGIDFEYGIPSASLDYVDMQWIGLGEYDDWLPRTGSTSAETSVFNALPLPMTWVRWRNSPGSDYFSTFEDFLTETYDYRVAMDARCEIAVSPGATMAYMSIVFRPASYAPNFPMPDKRDGQKQILAIRSESGVTLHETTGYGWFTDNAGDASGGYDFLANPVIYPPYRFR